jgi:hypothetical protein
MIVKNHIIQTYSVVDHNQNKKDYVQQILQMKYNVDIEIPKMNQVQLIQNNLKRCYASKKHQS